MAKRKLLTYVLMVSRVFPAYHPRKGQYTFFKEAIEAGVEGKRLVTLTTSRRLQIPPVIKEQAGKIHTIRLNYDLWAKRAERINAGEAVLSIRQWSGLPYKSKQVEIMQLTKIGVQKIRFNHGAAIVYPEYIHQLPTSMQWTNTGQLLAKNDGLSFNDFWNWFCPPFKRMHIGRIMSFEGCVIHFTDFRY